MTDIYTSHPRQRVSRLLGTNFFPSEGEAIFLRTTIRETKQRLQLVDTELSAAQAIVDSLQCERDALAGYLEGHEVLFSPVRRMPPEIMSEIFIHCLPSNRIPFPSATEGPLLLSQICSSWRSVALATPQLWAALAVDFTDRNFTTRWALAKTWLSRSGMLPLSLSLSSWQNVAVNAEGPDLVSELCAYAHRLCSLELSLSTLLLSLIERIPHDSFPILETLVVDTSRGLSHPLSVFHSSPLLRRAHIKSTGFRVAAVTLPWSNLTHFTSNAPLSFSTAVDVLRQCSNLQECRITLAPDGPVDLPLDPLCLAHLCLLHIDTAASPAAFLDCLTLPALTNFAFAPTHAVAWPHAPFTALLARSRPPLAHLSIIVGYADDGDLAACLRAAPALRTLDLTIPLRQHLLTDAVLAQLVPAAGAGAPLVPRLESLRLRGFGCQAIDAGVFAAAVRARWAGEGGVVRLRTAQFPFWRRAAAPEGIVQLRAMGREGLQFISDESARPVLDSLVSPLLY